MEINREELIALRKAVPLSQSELAERAKIGLATLQQIEMVGYTRTPLPRTIRALAEALGVSVEKITVNDEVAS